MINASSVFKEQLALGNRNYLADIRINLANGTTLNIDNSKIMQSGLKIEDAVSSSGTFQIGSAIINKATITLNNMYDDYTDINFNGAVVNVYVGLELPDGTIESIRKGVYNVTSAKGQNSSVLTLECLDNMYKFDRAYSESTLVYPATIFQIVQDACTVCGVSLLTTTFDGMDYVIQTEPDKDSLTFRAVLMYATQIIAKWAKCDEFGRLKIDWYKNDQINASRILVTKAGNPILTTSGKNIELKVPVTADDYINGNVVNDMLRIESYFSDDIALEQSTITGVQVYEKTQDDKEVPYLYGNKGYVVSITDNKLIARGKEREIAQMIGSRVIGTSFHRMSVTALSDPTIECGDRAYIVTPKDKVYVTYINSTIFIIGNSQTFSCEGEEPEIAYSGTLSGNSQILIESSNNSAEKLNSYKRAVQLMTSVISNSLGMFTTQEQTANGGYIIYQHNKPLLSESDIIWKISEQGFMVSTDSGQTWNAGIDASGNAVVNVLSAVGINFDWAKGGTLTLGGSGNGNGRLNILNSSNTQIGYIDNTGVNFNKGTFSGTVSAGSVEGSAIVGSTLSSAKPFNDEERIYIHDSTIDFEVPTYSPLFGGWFYGAGDIKPRAETVASVQSGETDELPTISINATWGFGLFVTTYRIFDSIMQVTDEGNQLLTKFHRKLQVKAPLEADQLYVSGYKARVVNDTPFGDLLMYCQESTTPYFTDIGFGKTDENGECTVAIDGMFSETINPNVEYFVFLQKEGQGELWVEEKDFAYFVVKGTPNLKFSWELKAVQNKYEDYRMEDLKLERPEPENNAEQELDEMLESEEISYEDFESFSDY